MENLQELKENFDTVAYLEEREIDYSLEGNNVTQGWVNIQCPYCGDHSNHCGINYTGGNYFSCWMCNESGDIIRLIETLEQMDFMFAVRRLKEFQQIDLLEEEKEEGKDKKQEDIIPVTAQPIVAGNEPDIVKMFMEYRRFTLSYLQKYTVYWDGFAGEYPFSLIVPVFVDGRVVSWQRIELEDISHVRYIHCPKELVEVPNNKLLYGIDDIMRQDQIVLVEGVLDKWRIGDCGLALFGKNFCASQLYTLKERAEWRRIKILLDADAYEEANQLYMVLVELGFYEVMEPILLESGDPSDLPDDEVEEILGL